MSRNQDDFMRLREALRRELLADGWHVGQSSSCAVGQESTHVGELGKFGRPLRGDFFATVMFWWECEDDSTLEMVITGCVGVEHRPARDLLDALTGSDVVGVALREPVVTVRGPDARNLLEKADELANFASDQMSLLSQVADVDTVVELLYRGCVLPVDRSMTDIDAIDDLRLEHNQGQLVSAMFASSGRHDEARRALTEYTRPGSEDAWSPREYHRFVRQLTRLLDMGSPFSLPMTIPRWPACGVEPQPPRSLRQLVFEQHPVAQRRREAVETVRGISKGKTSYELQTLLARELDQRQVDMDQDLFDAMLDFVITERKLFGRVRVVLRGVRAAWKLGSASRKRPERICKHSPDDLEAEPKSGSEWLMSPGRAAYPIWSFGDRRVAVELDPAARVLFDRILQTSQSDAGKPRFVEVWLTWANRVRLNGLRIEVHIGHQRVGQLDVDASEHFRPAMEAATERDEDPWMTAHLSRRSRGEIQYGLEIAVPEPILL